MLGFLTALEQTIPEGASRFRTVIRVVLGLFIALLLSYIVLEQVGSWRRRRSGRE